MDLDDLPELPPPRLALRPGVMETPPQSPLAAVRRPISVGENGEKRTRMESQSDDTENRKRRPQWWSGVIPQHMTLETVDESRPTTPIPGIDSALTRRLEKNFDSGAKIYSLISKLVERVTGRSDFSQEVIAILRGIVADGVCLF